MGTRVCEHCKSIRLVKKGHFLYLCKCCLKEWDIPTDIENKLMRVKEYRQNDKFEEAESLCHDILNNKNNSPEIIAKTYFQLILASFGIVYVTGFASNTPTATFNKYNDLKDSIKNSGYYKKLLEQDIDDEDKQNYIKRLNDLEEQYQNLKKDMETTPFYDAFICVKVSCATENNPEYPGKTDDFYRALGIYEALSKCEIDNKPLNVFLSEMTLKGSNNDPKIYSALTKSKCFILISSKIEYINSAWVKSEWKRWYKLIDTKRRDDESIFVLLSDSINTNDLPHKIVETQHCKSDLKLVNDVKKYLQVQYDNQNSKYQNQEEINKIQAKMKEQEDEISELKKQISEIGITNNKTEKKDVFSKVRNENKSIDSKFDSDGSSQNGKKDFDKNKSVEEQSTINRDMVRAMFKQMGRKPAETDIDKVIAKMNNYKYESKGLEYKLDSDRNSYIVSGIGSCHDESVIIPMQYNNLPVSCIGTYAFSECDSVKKIVIHNNILNIESYAFSECSNLIEIIVDDLNSEYCSIDGCLFSKDGKKMIKHPAAKYDGKMVVPNFVTSIASDAFEGCENIYYNGTIEEWCNIEFGDEYSNPMYYAEHFYMKDSNNEYYEVTELEIPNTVTSIGSYQFYGFDNLVHVAIPNSVTIIGDHAFDNCRKLTGIDIPHSVTIIGEGAFSDCDNLTTIKIPSSVISVGRKAFGDVILNVEYDRLVLSFSYPKIYCEVESEPKLWHSEWNHSGGSIIPTYWGVNKTNFYEKDNIQYVLTEERTAILTNYNRLVEDDEICSKLNINGVSYDVDCIGEMAFDGCKNLKTIFIPKSMKCICENAFYGCNRDLIIHCEIDSKPRLWDNDWNPDAFEVVWGYKKKVK